MEPPAEMEPSNIPLPLLSSPRIARTGPIKTGGRVFVLDHKRWTQPTKAAIDGLLDKFHGQKDMLKSVNKEYAAMVHQSATDPNSLLHPTTKHHINQYIKHLAKHLNTSSSLNTSPEKLMETQKLWQSLTKGSETLHVPVLQLPHAIVNPPDTSPLTQQALQKIVEDIMEQQQQWQQQQQQKPRQTKTCLSCGQPKSRFLSDGSSVHHFYQQGPVRYHYCSKKVFKAYSAEGLTNPSMPFAEFAQTHFFLRELELTKRRVEEKAERKRKLPDPPPQGRMCRFCRAELKQGPNSVNNRCHRRMQINIYTQLHDVPA
ncbi:uncharacterized protein [Pagrus major]|uniref:uncharacterized protein n=1 Tax=Pagrus major TaxID=143350 RepID=UPI003CC8C3D4